MKEENTERKLIEYPISNTEYPIIKEKLKNKQY